MNEIYNRNLRAVKEKHPNVFEKLQDLEKRFPYSYEKIINKKSEVNVSVDVPGTSGLLYYDCGEKGIMESAIETLSAQILKRNDLLMCLGMGLGYIPLAAIETYPDKPKIVIIEPFLEAFDVAISLVDLTELFEYDKLEIHLGGGIIVERLLHRYSNDFSIGTTRRITHLPYRKIFGQKFISFEKQIDDTISHMFTGWNTIKGYGETLFENSIYNLISLFDGTTIDHLKDKFIQMPAVVVGSGPSLGKDLINIKKIKDHALILSCDSSIRPLLSENIVPHMFFSVDYKNRNFDKIRLYLDEIRKSIFVYWTETNIDSVRGFLGNKRVGIMASNQFINGLIRNIFGNSFNLPGGITSNSDMAILTAIYLGCNPIILSGMDLAFSEGKDHTEASTLRSRHKKNDVILVDGLDGRPVYSLLPMVSGRIALENNINIHKKEFIDTSLSGAYIRGSKIKSLEELIDTLPKKDIRFDEVIDKVDWTPSVELEKAIESMDKISDMAEDLMEDSKKSLIDICNLLNNKLDKKDSEMIKKVRESLDTLNRFKAKHKIALMMLNNYRYKEQLDIDRNIANIGVGNELSVMLLNKEALSIQKKYYRSVCLSIRKGYRQVKKKADYFKEINRIEAISGSENKNSEMDLVLARRHAKEGMVWLAERSYKSYLKTNPDDVAILIELSDLYLNMRMWDQVKIILESYRCKSNEMLVVEKIKSKLDNCLMLLLESAKTKINNHKMDRKEYDEARLDLLEVLSIYPEHEEANHLFNKIIEFEVKQENEMNSAMELSYSSDECVQLEIKANQFVSDGEYEKAIGIYEGFIKKFPEKEKTYRILIGDLRFESCDYMSAFWNYQKCAQKFPDDKKIIYRIRHVKPMIEAASIEANNKNIFSTVILMVEDEHNGLKDILKAIDRALSKPSEIVLLCGSKKSKNKCLEVIKYISNNLSNNYRVVETEPKNVISINNALKKANGNNIILLDVTHGGNYKKIDYLIRQLNKNNTIGLGEPWILNKKPDPVSERRNIDFSIRDKESEIFGIRKDILIKIGLLDPCYNSFNDALEDLQIRARLKNVKNKCFWGLGISNTSDWQGSIKHFDNKNKWHESNIPVSDRKKYNITKACMVAESLFRKDNINQAIKVLVDSIKQYPECDLFYRLISQMLINENRSTEALQVLESNSETSSTDDDKKGIEQESIWDRAYIKAYASFYAGKIQDAIKRAEKVLFKNSHDFKMLNLKGMAEFLHQNNDNANKYFQSAIRLNPNFGLPWFYLGAIKHSRGDKKRAYKLIRRGFLCNPEDKNISNEYYQYGKTEKFDDVLLTFERIINLVPDNKHLNYLFIDLLIQSKNYKGAMDCIEKCIVMFGKEDGIINAALSIRKLLGPNGNGSNDREKAALVNIDSEIDSFEIFLYDLKSRTDKIDFVDNKNCPFSKNIASVFGATIINDLPTSNGGNNYLWHFDHNDVVSAISEKHNAHTENY